MLKRKVQSQMSLRIGCDASRIKNEQSVKADNGSA